MKYEILIQDREDRQGIEVKGEADHVCELLIRMQETLLDAIIVGFLPTDDSEPSVIANLELPGAPRNNWIGQIGRGSDSKELLPVKNNKPGSARNGGNRILRASRRPSAPGKEAHQASNSGPFNQRRHGQA